MTFWGITVDGLNSSSRHASIKNREFTLVVVYGKHLETTEIFENDNATLSPMSIFSNDGDLSLLYLRSLVVSASIAYLQDR